MRGSETPLDQLQDQLSVNLKDVSVFQAAGLFPWLPADKCRAKVFCRTLTLQERCLKNRLQHDKCFAIQQPLKSLSSQVQLLFQSFRGRPCFNLSLEIEGCFIDINIQMSKNAGMNLVLNKMHVCIFVMCSFAFQMCLITFICMHQIPTAVLNLLSRVLNTTTGCLFCK